MFGLNDMKNMAKVLCGVTSLREHERMFYSALQLASRHKSFALERQKARDKTEKRYNEGRLKNVEHKSVKQQQAFEIEFSVLHYIRAVEN